MQKRPSRNGTGLPEGLRRLGNRKILVDFQARFPDGTAFRRNREFESDELRPAINFLERAKADFARGNGVGSLDPNSDKLTVASWTTHCVDFAMPAQRNGSRPKYSDEALQGFRFMARTHIVPKIGEVPLEELDKRTVTELIAGLPSDEVRAKVLNVLTRVMQLAESKGKRKKGTNPCKGVSTGAAGPKPQGSRPENWREEAP